jgi:hypothetical protein
LCQLKAYGVLHMRIMSPEQVAHFADWVEGEKKKTLPDSILSCDKHYKERIMYIDSLAVRQI